MGDAHNIDGHKLDCHIDRVAEWKYRGDTLPVYVEISPTARCNHACAFCALDFTNHTNVSIPAAKLLKIGTDLSGIARGVMFGGEGEPTLVPYLPEVIHHYMRIGIATALTTNGSGLTPEFAIEGGRELSWVKVSINGGDAESYGVVHRIGVGEFERVWERIRSFKQACGGLAPTIGVQCVVTGDNVMSLPALLERVGKEDLDYLVLKPLNPNAYSPACRDTTPTTIPKSTLVELRNSVYSNRLVVRDRAFSALQSTQEYSRCLSVPFFWAYIRSNMDLVACSNHMQDERFVLGNLEHSSFKAIWYSHSTMKREELKHVMRSFDVSQCRKACRMNSVNQWLWKISHSGAHGAFI